MNGRSFLYDLWFSQTLRHKIYMYIYTYIYTYIELQGRLIPKVLDSDRGAVIEFFKQRNYCFPKQ